MMILEFVLLNFAITFNLPALQKAINITFLRNQAADIFLVAEYSVNRRGAPFSLTGHSFYPTLLQIFRNLAAAMTAPIKRIYEPNNFGFFWNYDKITMFIFCISQEVSVIQVGFALP